MRRKNHCLIFSDLNNMRPHTVFASMLLVFGMSIQSSTSFITLPSSLAKWFGISQDNSWEHPAKVSLSYTGENSRFDQCILDWTNQCKSRLPLAAKSAFLQTATAAHISGPIFETFSCSGSLKPGSFGYLRQAALALIGPI